MIKITDSVVIYDSPELLEVSGVELAASDIIPAIGARKTVRIMADRFHLNGMLAVPEGEVTLMARHIIGSEGAGIDVSGTNGRDAPDTPKPKPTDANAPAPDGMDGPDEGGDAGTIVLVAQRFDGISSLVANGGRGSRGQPGGNAADGAPGRPSDKVNHQGGNGGDAGPIGRAGASRNSGNGGTVRIFANVGSGGISTSVVGGPEVPSVNHGRPGRPGEKGRGGKEKVCVEVDDRGVYSVGSEVFARRLSCRFTGQRLPNGRNGAPSPQIEAAPVSGLKGQDGQVVTGEPAAHGAVVPLRGLRLLLLEAEMLHIQAAGSGQDAQQAMLASAEMAGFVLVMCLGSANPAVSEVAARASALMHRIASGSPPEGTRGLEVSLTPLTSLLETLRYTLESRWRGTTYIDALKADSRDEQTIRNAINEVQRQAIALRSDGDARLLELRKRRKTVVDTIDGLSSNFQILWKEVLDADQAFQDEVRRKNPCAEFLDIAIVVASIAVTVISGGAAAASAVAAGGEVLSYITEDEERKKAYQAGIKEAGGLKTRLQGYAKDAQDFVDRAQDLKEFLGGDALTPPGDQVKIAMSREDFNNMIEPYRELSTAEELKRRMDRFLSLTETRNSLLLEHDQIVVETAAIRAQMDAAKQQVDELVGNEGAAVIDTTIEAYEAALWLDLEVGKRVMGLLQAANRAYEYLSLKPRTMNLSTTRGDNLENEYSRLISDSALILRPDELSRDAVCEITISRATHPETFEALASGAAIVSLMPEHVPEPQKDRWDERAYAVGIKINGLRTRPRDPVVLQASMVSCGIAWFRNRGGAQISMRVPMRDATDVPVSTALDLNEVRASRNLLGVEIGTVEASPYGLWQLRIPGIEEHLREGGIDQVSLTFCFIGTARISHKVAALVDARRQELLPLLEPLKHDFLGLSIGLQANMPVDDAEEYISSVEDLHGAWPDSPLEDAMLVRRIEDATYVPIMWVQEPPNQTSGQQE